MNKLLILLAMTLVFSMSHLAYAEKKHHNNGYGHRVSSNSNQHKHHHKRKHYNKRHSYNHRKHRRHNSYNPLGYFVTGAIVGSLLNNHGGDNHGTREVRRTSNTYWSDQYGDCYRIDNHQGREIYTSVSARYCN